MGVAGGQIWRLGILVALVALASYLTELSLIQLAMVELGTIVGSRLDTVFWIILLLFIATASRPVWVTLVIAMIGVETQYWWVWSWLSFLNASAVERLAHGAVFLLAYYLVGCLLAWAYLLVTWLPSLRSGPA